MKILEHPEKWQADFEKGWLDHYCRTGKFDWKLYTRPKNESKIQSRGIDLKDSRSMLISSAGGYLRDHQEPFDAKNDLGDYTIRQFPLSTPLENLEFAHDHYKHDALDQDVQVVLPLRHLENLHTEGIIGKPVDTVISFMGYHPDVTRVINETIPPIIETALTEKIRSALLIPV